MNLETTTLFLFALATAVALIARALKITYPVALVLAGLGLGAARILPAPHLTKDLLYAIFLPGLIFEAAYHLGARQLEQNKRLILGLAFPGVLFAVTLTTGLLLVFKPFGPGTSLAGALVFAALISATDPIAVVGLFKRLGAPRRLGVIVEGESLVNDGTSVVAYTLALLFATSGALSLVRGAFDFAEIVGLGVVVGAAIGFCVSNATARIADPLLQITLTGIAAYGSFVIAEELHFSGILATVAAGIVCGSFGAPRRKSPTTRLTVEGFWDYVAFALNSIVFLLIGLEVTVGTLVADWKPIVAAYLIVFVARAAVVFGASASVRRTSERIPWSWGLVMTWGGLRGALSMVLALALPAAFPERSLIISTTFGVVILSIILNGLTTAPLLRRLGLFVAGPSAP